MKRALLFLLALTASTLACQAQVEPRLAGDWSESNATGHFSMNISTNGRYTRHHNGQTDSGKITAHDGNWQLHSDSGKIESGRFSMLGGSLKFSGGSMPSPLSKGQSGHFNSPSNGYTPPAHINHVQSTSAPAPTPTPAPNVVPSHQPLPVVDHAATQPMQQQMQPVQTQSLKQTIKNKLIQTINSIPVYNSNQPMQSQTYQSMYGKQNTLPGYAPNQDLTPSNQSQSSAQTSTTGLSQASINGPTANQNNNAGYSKRIITPDDFDKWAAVQQMQTRSQVQRVPRGGYIPVMKDGKARRYFQGR